MDAADGAVRAQGLRGAQGRRPPEGRPSTAPAGIGSAGWRRAARRPTSSATRASPTSSSSAAARAASRSARGCASSACRPSSSSATSAPATPGASATSRSACTTRSGTTTCPTCQFPDNWPVFSPKDKIGDWLEMYTKVMELNYWALHRLPRAPRYDEDAQEWTVAVEREGEEVMLRPKQLVLATGMSGMPNVPEIPGADDFRGRPAPLQPAPGAGRLRGQEGRRDRLQQLGPRHLRGAVGAGRGRHDDPALLDAHRPQRLADGHRAGRALLRAGGGGRHHHRQGRPDVRLAALPDPATSSRSRSTTRCASATPTSTSGSSGPASCSTSARTARGCS